MMFLLSFFIFKSSALSCQSIFDALPSHVRVITDTHASCSGPNCHNAVSYWHKLSQDLTLIGWRDLQRHLSNPKKFRRLKKNESPRFGDVIAFRFGPKDTILHSAIYLSEKSLWEKEGDSSTQPWRVTASEEVHKEYEGLVVEYYRKI